MAVAAGKTEVPRGMTGREQAHLRGPCGSEFSRESATGDPGPAAVEENAAIDGHACVRIGSEERVILCAAGAPRRASVRHGSRAVTQENVEVRRRTDSVSGK